MVDLSTGEVTALPESIATSGTYYAVSPNHTMVAYNQCCAQPGPILVANIDGTGIHTVTRDSLDAYGAQWSPGGSRLVYQQRDASTSKLGNLFVLDVSTGLQTQITHFDQTKDWNWWFTFPSFGADGRSILFQLPRGNTEDPAWDLWGVPVAGGEPSLVHRNVGWGGFAPAGYRNLLYLSPMNGSDFTGRGLWTTSSDARLVRPRALVRANSLAWPRWSPDGNRISYSDGGSVYVVDVATGVATNVAEGGNPEWFDDHTLIVGGPLT